MAYKRKFSRLSVECLGDIHRSSEIISCKIVDLCEQGMRVKTTTPMTVGDELALVFILGKTRKINCTVKVVRATASDFGAQIVTMSPDDQTYLREFIDDLFTTTMGRY